MPRSGGSRAGVRQRRGTPLERGALGGDRIGRRSDDRPLPGSVGGIRQHDPALPPPVLIPRGDLPACLGTSGRVGDEVAKVVADEHHHAVAGGDMRSARAFGGSLPFGTLTPQQHGIDTPVERKTQRPQVRAGRLFDRRHSVADVKNGHASRRRVSRELGGSRDRGRPPFQAPRVPGTVRERRMVPDQPRLVVGAVEYILVDVRITAGVRADESAPGRPARSSADPSARHRAGSGQAGRLEPPRPRTRSRSASRGRR